MASRGAMRGAIVAVAGVLLAGEAAAQVNVETLRRDPDASGWSGLLEGSLALAAGNLERVDVGGKGQVQLQALHPHVDRTRPPYPRARVLLIASGAYGEVEGVTAASQAFTHAREARAVAASALARAADRQNHARPRGPKRQALPC